MNKIQKFTVRLVGILASLLLLFSLTPAVKAQNPGNNGRILWSATNSLYSILPNNTYLLNTTLTSLITYSFWQAIYTPNGQYIVYSAKASSGAKSNLYIIDAARTISPVAITNLTTCDAGDPSSNSNGTKIAFSCYDGTNDEIYVINLSTSGGTITSSGITGSPTKLTNQAEGLDSYNPVWNPDNSLIYVKNGEYIRSISPSTANQTTATDVYFVGVSFDLSDISPDGSKFLYSRVPTSETSNQLYTVGVGGTSNTRIVSAPTLDYYGGYFSPDGNYIATTALNIDTTQMILQIMTTGGSLSSTLNYGAGEPNGSRVFWSIDQNTYSSSPAPSPSPTPGAPNTASAIIAKFKSNPLALSFAIAGLLSLVSVGAYWLRTELKSKK